MIKSASRQPRGMVLLNGTRVSWIDFEINNNAYYQADTFRVTIPIKSQPAGIDTSWWAAQEQIEVELYIGFPSDPDNYSAEDLDIMFAGTVDILPHEMVSGVISLAGRDYTGKLIDTKTSMKWPGKTSSDIATMLASKYELTPAVTKTNKKVGVYIAHENAKMQIQWSEWDLLNWLAKQEGFQVYVAGTELHFEPKTASAPIYHMEWLVDDIGNKHFDGTSLTFERNLNLARDVIVYVHVPSSPKNKKGFTKEAKEVRNKDKVLNGKGQVRVGTPQVFTYTIPNLSPEQALQKAQTLLRDITRHQIKMLAVGIPADNILTPRHIILVSGTGIYDQQYNPDSVTRKISKQDGYLMDIVAKNHDINSQVPLIGSR